MTAKDSQFERIDNNNQTLSWRESEANVLYRILLNANGLLKELEQYRSRIGSN